MTKALTGKTIAITGASSGLGAAAARHMVELGAKVALAARRTDRLEGLAKELGPAARSYTVDVSKREQVSAFIESVVRDFGRLDVLVNNAGLMAIAPLSQGRSDEWDKMIDINIKGVLYGIAAALPVFERQGSGHFINVASVAGHKVFSPGGAVYSGTKYAVRAISEGLRQEVGSKIRVTTISPGAIDSELKFGSDDAQSRERVVAFYKQAIAPSSVARAIAYAIEQPPDVDINEVVLRPTAQEF